MKPTNCACRVGLAAALIGLLAPRTAVTQEVITSTASATYGTIAGIDSVTAPSVTTTKVFPELFLEKILEGPFSATVGQEVSFTIRYGNNSADVVARDVVVIDSLPDGLDYVSSQPDADIGDRTLSWVLGELAPGDTSQISVVLRVSGDTRDTTRVRNVAAVTSANASARSVVAPEVELIGISNNQISLEKVADVLEVRVGETVPYRLTVRNVGLVPVSDIRIHDLLPEGSRYSDASAIGADSVTAIDQDITFFVGETIAPGGEHSVRYQTAVVSAESDVIENRAHATAEGEFVRSEETVAWVRVRKNYPMETRGAIGKVWIDQNGNGAQDGGEAGLAGIDVWTDDGEVATTDEDGKFSFRNLRPGGHAFRVDIVTVPTQYSVPASEDLVVLTADGWTTPNVLFRIVPTQATLLQSIEMETPDSTRSNASAGSARASDARDVREKVAASQTGGPSNGPNTPFGASLTSRTSVPLLPTNSPLSEVGDEVVTTNRMILVIEPSIVGWPEVTYVLEPEWEFVPGSAVISNVRLPDPEIRWDRAGQRYLYWHLDAFQPGTIRFHAQPADNLGIEEKVSLPPLRSVEEREAEASRAFVAGPGVEVFSLADGAVLASDRMYVGVRGEAGSAVELFDGDSLIGVATLRIDGVHDFVGVGLVRGPHRLRVRMPNSWNQNRWDSLLVHVSGTATAIDVPTNTIQMSADGQSIREVRIRIRDQWGVPVVNPTNVTISATGVEPLGTDVDPSSVGFQLATDRAGWLMVPLVAGHEVGMARVFFQAANASAEMELEVLPAIRPLMITGVGQFGFGASPDAFGAVTARGRLDYRTAVTVSVDSRRLNAGREDFDRAFDPLEEAQYPILGDASRGRTVSSSRFAVAARVERGFDWVAFGDVSTSDFGSGLELNTYRRSFSAGMARVTTGPVVWRGFGTVTSQSLQQTRLRGAGISGPYMLGSDVARSTEQIVIETRDRENPQRVVTRQILVRFIDYEIDYETGTLLFKRPVPSTDFNDNPVFVEVTFEAGSGGDKRAVGGLRASLNASELINTDFLDSVQVGLTGIRANEIDGSFTLAGADVRVIRIGGLEIGGELSRSEVPDSSGVAGSVDAALELLDGALRVGGGFMKIGFGFNNPSNTGLRSGTEEVRVSGRYRFRQSEFLITHEHMSFSAEDVVRQRTIASLRQRMGDQLQLDVGQVTDRYQNGLDADRSLGGEAKLTYTPRAPVSFWMEGRRQFASSGNLTRPDQVGVGAAFQIFSDVAVEARYRQVLLPEEQSYSVTNFGVRSNLGFGTQAYGSYQLAGGVGREYNAALIGLNNRTQIGSAWTLNTLFERRVGLDQADITDPVRTLPFLQTEEDYWSAGLGLELLPQDAPYRMSMRGEYRDGAVFSTRLFSLAGDVSINRSLAVLSRQRFLETNQTQGLTRQLSSVWGLAFRPFNASNVNVLTKFSWLKEQNPINGGVLIQRGDEKRMVGAAETIWLPTRRAEVAARYAVRQTLADRLHDDGVTQNLESMADFVGLRFGFDINRWLTFRSEGRVLHERTSNVQRWDLAPSLGFRVVEGMEVSAGYRFGDLRDPDFSVRGGHGVFLTFGVRVTEKTLPTAARFWRTRF